MLFFLLLTVLKKDKSSGSPFVCLSSIDAIYQQKSLKKINCMCRKKPIDVYLN